MFDGTKSLISIPDISKLNNVKDSNIYTISSYAFNNSNNSDNFNDSNKISSSSKSSSFNYNNINSLEKYEECFENKISSEVNEYYDHFYN